MTEDRGGAPAAADFRKKKPREQARGGRDRDARDQAEGEAFFDRYFSFIEA